MTNPAFNPEDPRLTGFVLGEIDDGDRAEIEQLLETSPEAQAAVKEIEETIGVLKEGLASEPTPELTAEQRAAVEEQLAGPKVSPTLEASPARSSGSFGKIVGAVASVAALGIVATLVLPSVQNASRLASTPNAQLMVMDDISEMEEASTDDLDSRIRTAAAVAETAGSNETTKRWGRVEEAADVSIASKVASPAATDSFGAYPGGSRNSATGHPAADSVQSGGAGSGSGKGRELAKRDESRLAQTAPGDKSGVDKSTSGFAFRADQAAPAEKPADAAAQQAKEVSRTDSPQRLIADSGSRPPGKDGQMKSGEGREGRSEPGTGRPFAAPGNSDTKTKNESLTASTKTLPRGFRPPPPVPTSGERGQDKVSLSTQLSGAVGSKSVEGARASNSQPAKPQPYGVVDKKSSMVKGAADSPDPVAGVALQPESAPATANGPRGVTSLSDQSVAFKKNLSLSERQKRASQKQKASSGKLGFADGLASTDEDRSKPEFESATATLKQEAKKFARDADQTVVVGQKLEQLSERIREEQVQLAAIDSGATRRARVRGFGMEGRDLQEQLLEYSKELSLARTTRERMPEARQSGYGSEYYAPIVENDFIVPVVGDKEKSLSTISVDVDTASYANMRRFLNRDQLPPANSVRVEELINYFKYDYPEPEGDEPFSVKTELAMCPWQPTHRLAMVGLKAKTIDKAQRPPTNLVFLLDVSGSMRASNKLPLVQQSMRLLVEEMTEDDRVSIVTYASNAGVRLQSTLGSKKQEILTAINGLRAGGSTNGEGGIRMAYDEANRHYFQGGANRVILCSDGDFNVGRSSDGELVELIQEKAASGVFLSVFGFGMGNLKDAKLEKLADKGNGHYGYIDNLNEAKKVFQDELVGTLYTVAKDVKLQVEFNPATVGAYRLIGYENRKLAAQDFTDDTKDAGEIGSGHTVTALYEIIPKQVLLAEPKVDGLKYQASAKKSATDDAGTDPSDKPADVAKLEPVDEELLTVKLRYKKPDEEVSEAVNQDYPVKDVSIAGKQLSAVSDDLMFAASVASFGMNLRGSKYRGKWGFAEALESAQGAQGDGNDTQRTEFIQLVQRAMRITGQQTGPHPSTSQGTTTRPGELDATAARIKASVNGKYRRLIKKIEVRDDFRKFGAFNDFGHWDGTEYSGHKDLPPGNWVYVYPNWYLWAEAVVPPVEDKPAEATEIEDKSGSTRGAVK